MNVRCSCGGAMSFAGTRHVEGYPVETRWRCGECRALVTVTGAGRVTEARSDARGSA